MRPSSVTHLLATDLDGTFVGDRQATQELLEFFSRQPYEVKLVYITGRHFQSAMELINEENLPFPEALITDVGASITDFTQPWIGRKWAKHIDCSWTPERLRSAVKGYPGLFPQTLPASSPRLSYEVKEAFTVQELEKYLLLHQLAFNLIFSSGKDVDILPPDAGKGKALSFWLRERGWTNAQVLIAGDSGNDAEMLSLPYPAVIVGNAQEELLELLESHSLYRSSNACAAGILDAWKYFYHKALVP